MTEKTTEAGKAAQEVVEVVTTTVSPLTEFSLDKMEKFFAAAEKVLAQYGGDAVDLGLNVLRIDALSILLPSLLGVCVGVVLMVQALKVIPTIDFDKAITAKQAMFGFLSPLLCLPIFVENLPDATNLWAWVGTFYPELYAVHKFLL